ncbi:MAG: HPr family phosphocarrier protein, partial [Rhodospirillaceae bacterium]|nr:HPr family phosphocarrier protein [Rhodospirillaceae bacterium]
MSGPPPERDAPFSATLQILNQRGLHARAAAKFVKTAGVFDAD